ncbi:hypothetical protein LTR95_011375 [Oleoguttula sp. CCFEE 5521]
MARVPINYLKHVIGRHVQSYEDVKTMFSSWSPSLKFVLNLWAYVHGGGPGDVESTFIDAYIIVIDTAKLPAANRIFYVSYLTPMYAE